MTIPQDSEARRYYRVAKQRLEEADLILSKAKLPAAAVYIAGYAVECILKALLLTLSPVGERPGMLISLKHDFGHSLSSLHDGVRERGAAIPGFVSSELLYVSSWSPERRYIPGPGDAREAQRFINAARTIVNWADGRM